MKNTNKGEAEVNTTTNWYDLAFRNYDPSIGRLMQIDPMASKYASLSAYHYSFNNPVSFNDPNGADPYEDWNNNNPTGCRYCNELAHSGSTMESLWNEQMGRTNQFYGQFTAEMDLLQRARSGNMDAIREYAAKHGGLSIMEVRPRVDGTDIEKQEDDQQTTPEDDLAEFINFFFKGELRELTKMGKVTFWIDAQLKYLPYTTFGGTAALEDGTRAAMVLNIVNFLDARTLYVTLAHEFVHARDILNGNEFEWQTKYEPSVVETIMEYHAYLRSAELEAQFGIDNDSQKWVDKLAPLMPEGFKFEDYKQ